MIRILTMLFILTACNTANSPVQPKDNFIAGIFQADDLSFYDFDQNIKIHLGMSKEEVEAAIGKPIDTIDFLNIYEYPGLKIHYRNNLANALIIDDNTENFNKFMTPRRIQYGDNEDLVTTNYGNQAYKEVSGNNTALTYIFEKMSNGYELRNSYKEAEVKENIFTLSMNIDRQEGIYSIMIADYIFSTNPSG